jgi:hypothetical protein
MFNMPLLSVALPALLFGTTRASRHVMQTSPQARFLPSMESSSTDGTCPSVGQPCSTLDSFSELCDYTQPGLPGSRTVTPAFCNYTGYSSYYRNGTCLVPTPAQRSDRVYGSTCNPAAPVPMCSSFDPFPSSVILQCARDSRCVYAAPTVGNPCLSDSDCFAGNDALVCSAALGVCQRLANATAGCTSNDSCNAGTYCNTTACVPVVPIGDSCSFVKPQFRSPIDPCAARSICFNASSSFPFEDDSNGTCTALNALPSGAIFYANSSYFGGLPSLGVRLCASGLAVPVPDVGELGLSFSDHCGRVR